MQPKAVAKLLRVLSTERRIQILKLLVDADAPLSSSTIAAQIGLGSGQTSANLTELASVGLVLPTPSGRHVFYLPNRSLINQTISFFKGSKDESL